MRKSRTPWHVAAIPALLLAALPLCGQAQQLSPQQLFRQVAPSVVVIEVREFPEGRPSKLVASGSGVVVPNRDAEVTAIATNCHLVDQARDGAVSIFQGSAWGIGWVAGRDVARDLCMVNAFIYTDADGNLLGDSRGESEFRKLPAVQVGSSQWLEVGDPVYAVGAPQGLELTLSDGLVSGFREQGGVEYVQTTAPISRGSSGGGIFDAYGRLVGITTMYLKDGQALNFAVPAELIASVPEYQRDEIQAAPQRSELEPAIRSHQGRWHEIHHSSIDIISYMDRESKVSSGNSVSAWIKSTSGYGSTWIVEGRSVPYHEEFERITFFCDTWEILVSQSYITDRQGVQIEWRGENGPFTVSPTSGYDSLIRAVCSL